MIRSAKLRETKPLNREQVECRGRSYWINYMPAALMREARFSGFTYKGQVYLSEELTGKSKQFGIQHELYHLRDKQHWLGYFGQELRANTVRGIRDPFGLVAHLYAALKKGYLKTYLLSLVGIRQD